ncbi:MAG: SDR family oxidoreductase [Actinobacteria bacterium]|nr:SDR family oxidoreductase [Actinomycetota bacterium]
MSVVGKSIVVVGATSGIGAATVRRLVAGGAEVTFAGRRSAPGEALAAELGERAVFQRADITVEAEVETLFAAAADRRGSVDGAVNCAGEPLPGAPVQATDVAGFERYVGSFAAGAVSFTKHAALHMLPARSGSIVHVTSVAGHFGGWSGIAYSAAKAALLQIVRSAAVELGESGVRVNSVCPGPILTGMFAKAAGVDPSEADVMEAPEQEFAELVSQWQAMPGVGYPDDVAAAAAWLVGDDARFVNGVDVPVDGGIVAGRPASVGMPARAALAAAFRRREED